MTTMKRTRFTKEKIAALPLPPEGARSTWYDTKVPKLAVRITSAGTRTFYVVRRNGAAMVWLRQGVFPDMSVENAQRAAQGVLGDYSRGIDPAAKKRAERAKQTFGQAFEEYLDLHVKARGVKSGDAIRAMYARCLGPLGDPTPKKHGRRKSKHPAGVDWSARKLDAIKNEEVRKLHAMIGRKQPTTADRVVELLRTIYNRAIEFGYTGDNPARGIEPLDDTERDRFLTAPELPKFFEALREDTSEDFKHFVLLALLTGARRGNVLSSRWQDVDLQAATWRIPQTKNDEPLTLPLVPEAVELLRSRKPQPSGWIFPAPSKQGYMHAPKKRWRALLKRAGLADLRIHDLRRSLGSWQAITGASLVVIGKSLGHKSPDATAIYARLSLDPVRASVGTATAAMLAAAGIKKPAKVEKLKKRVARRAAA